MANAAGRGVGRRRGHDEVGLRQRDFPDAERGLLHELGVCVVVRPQGRGEELLHQHGGGHRVDQKQCGRGGLQPDRPEDELFDDDADEAPEEECGGDEEEIKQIPGPPDCRNQPEICI